MTKWKLSEKTGRLMWPRQALQTGTTIAVGVSIFLTGVAEANITGSDTQNFNPTASGRDYVTVHSAQTLGQGKFSLGLFMNHAVNTLPYFKDGDTRTSDRGKAFNDSVTSMELGASVGLLPSWDLGVSLPFVVAQTVPEEGHHGQFAEKGLTEVRATTKLKLWSNGSTGLALVGSANFNQLDANPFTGEGAGPSYNAEIVADTELANIALAANLGYRWRDAGEPVPDSLGATPVKPFENQMIASAAAGYLLPGTRTQLVTELYGSQSTTDVAELSTRSASSLEALAGVKQRLDHDFTLHGGLSTELQHSVSSPDYRIYAGLTWVSDFSGRSAPDTAPASQATSTTQEAASIVPAAATAPGPKPDRTIIVGDVLFAFNSAEISQEAARKNLAELGQVIRGPRGLKRLDIEGHTCSIGSDSYNAKLSRRRAEAIKAWLVREYKIPAAKIHTMGYGESRPIADNKTSDGRARNRRVEFKIFHAKPATPAVAQQKPKSK